MPDPIITKSLKTPIAADFVHLHNHTQYSLLDGLTQIEPLMDLISQQGMSAIAMTDHGTLSGTIDFYKSAIGHELNPIIGIESYVAARSHTDKDPGKDKARFHLILLAMNNIGYQNLMKLSTIANLEGFYYYPRIDHELLKKYNEGLIVLSACLSGEVGEALKTDRYDDAKEIAKWYKSVFGDRYYLEIQDHGHPGNPLYNKGQEAVNKRVLKLSKELNIEVVLTCDAHYLKHEDQEAHEILLCVGTASYLADEKRMSLKDFPLHVTSAEEIFNRWGKTHPEVILNTKKVAERCRVTIDLGNILIPTFPLPNNETESHYLKQLVYKGLAWRYGGKSEDEASKLTIAAAKKSLPKEVAERANYELSVIEQMNFNSYFLIIQDFINWGKDKGIVFGPGRGSAAGSIISYALKITELDPLGYDLLFERFLNPDRISMPDIDIDIQDSRRDEVIQYCINKYGVDRVANIVTFGRMFARNAVRDVARVLQVPYIEADRLAKMIPPPVQGRHIPLATSIKNDPELAAEYTENQTAKTVLDQAMKLEGTIRSHGVHAAGVVIAPDEIVKFSPLEMAQKGAITTQYAMGPIEELGLLKIDFLGLSNLTIIKNSLRIIKRVYKKDVQISEIPLDDKKTFELLQRGDTTGVFQLESAGMKRYLKQLKPTVFDDIVAMVALYRPGPMQWIDDFIARKHGLRKIEYMHPAMESALKSTHGVIVYQEQVMQISKEMCGFSGGQADTLRKAIGKKIPEVMKKLKDDFIEGAITTSGADRGLMEQFWRQLEDFAAYCFNKSHAACYGLIAYWTAYLKAHYPEAFMAALMTSDFDNIDRLAIEINECRHMGLEVLPPDVNQSFLEFAVVPGKQQIRFGLRAVKNVGTNTVEELLQVRDELGGFDSLEGLLSAINTRILNRKALESLIKCGAFDGFGERGTLFENIDVMLAFANKSQKSAASGQIDLFGSDESNKQFQSRLNLQSSNEEHTLQEMLQWERELLGLYLSSHPLEQYIGTLQSKTQQLNTITNDQNGQKVVVGGHVISTREITTKNGQKMAFVRLADQIGEIEVIVFPSLYQKDIEIWQRDRVVMIKGVVDTGNRRGVGDGELKIIAASVNLLEPDNSSKSVLAKKRQAKKTSPLVVDTRRVYVRLESSADEDKLLSLKQTIDTYPGQTEVVLVVGKGDKQIIRLPSRIAPDKGVEKLVAVLGEEHVKIQ